MAADPNPDPELVAAGESLLAARARGDLDALAETIDRWGVDLAHSPFATALYDVAAELPLDLSAARPGLAFRFEDIGRLPIGTTPLGLPPTHKEARAEFASNGDLRLRQALLPLTTRRRLGRFDEAMAIVRAATPLAEASVYPWYGDRSQILPYWYLQAGITAQVAGDLGVARRFFLNAWTHRDRDPYGFVARGTAGKLAQHDALAGDLASSATWLERALDQGRRADLWVDHFVESNLTTTSTIHAIDALDPQVDTHLHATLHPSQRSEQWVIFLWVFVQHALTYGDTASALGYLEDAVQARPPELIRAGLAAGVVPLVRAEIHLAMGQAHRALADIEDAPDVAGMTRTLRARTLLLADQAPAALLEVEALGSVAGTSRRARTESLLVATAAHLAVGDREAAVESARRAVVQVQEGHAPRLLATVPRTALDELAPDVPGLGPLLALVDERGVRDIYPADVQLISVTERERELLHDLGSDRTLAEIADDNYVSVNTVRTHLASLRRKLDARSRGEVLARARQLGLLDQ
ncbi:DNA-binding response regulator [Nocardioides marmoriginsengisoli]|uniref:DNA-binding response regulator n=1 Tax=Nocardioides marmoriginsengisoli TaxID=661483 RepID=A0A3N0CFK7_9ACTN|nr:DNA-binding response regulator [Nocardioides marmoriginsengisoli]